jgi:hypothetical protein
VPPGGFNDTVVGDEVRLKDAEAISPVGFPVTVIVYVACGALATTKDAETAPLLIEQVSEATAAPPDNAHDESLDENPEPETWMLAPTPAFEGLMVIEGIAELT